MSREAIIGLLSIVTVVGMVWGYKFVKGEVMLSRSYTFISVFEDVSQLAVSSPVLVNGLKVGAITDITVNPSNTKEMFVEYNVNGEFNLPKSTKAIMIRVAEEIKKILQSQMAKSLINADTQLIDQKLYRINISISNYLT